MKKTSDFTVGCFMVITAYLLQHPRETLVGVLAKKKADGTMDDIDREVDRLLTSGDYDKICGGCNHDD